MDDDPAADAASSWSSFCRRLDVLGERLVSGDFPDAPADRAEGFAHLADQVVCWLAWSLGHADPTQPAFHRHNDPITQWGGPNADNVYRHARIDPAHRYRIRGRMHGCEELVLALRAGFMHEERWGTLEEVTASELGIAPGDDFEILLGGDGGIPLDERVVMVSVREYYFDWQSTEPATFTIECLDGGGAAERTSEGSLAHGLAEAATLVERSLDFWNRYLRDARSTAVDNSFADPVRVTKGLAAARYAFCFWNLEPDEALYVETEAPDARYWSFQLYRLGWFEPLDLAHRTTSFNHTQARVDADGRVRLVLAAGDPGLPNWLDTEGRPEGLLTHRWFWGAERSRPRTQVVPLEDARSLFPAETPEVDPAERSEQIRRRREHLAWRFRT